MLDHVLTAAYPDATPMTLQRLFSVVDYDAWPKYVVRKNATADASDTDDKKGPVEVRRLPESYDALNAKDAFVWFIHGARMVASRSLWPLGFMFLTIILAGLAAWMMYLINPSYKEYGYLESWLVIGVIALGVICYARRWLVCVVEMRLSLTAADFQTPFFWEEPAWHLTPQDSRKLSPEELAAFTARTGIEVNSSGAFQAEFIASYLTIEKMRRAMWYNERNRKGMRLVKRGEVQNIFNSAYAINYNPRDVAIVELRKENAWLTRVIPILLLPVICATPMGLLALAYFATDSNSSAILGTLWFMAVTGWLFAVAFWAGHLLSAACRAISGTMIYSSDDHGFFDPLRTRLRIRSVTGRWTDLLLTPQPALAVEVYNLISREIRKPTE